MLMRCITTYECTVFDDMPNGVEIGDTDLQQMDTTDECGWVYTNKYAIGVRHDYHGLATNSVMQLRDECCRCRNAVVET